MMKKKTYFFIILSPEFCNPKGTYLEISYNPKRTYVEISHESS